MAAKDPVNTPDKATMLDGIDRQLLDMLQRDGRRSFADLGRQVGLSAPAAADRVKRLEAAGILRGFRAVLDRAALGWALTAFVRIRAFAGKDTLIEARAAATPEILECHEIAGEDSYLLKVAARDVAHLDRVITALAPLGSTRSTLVLSTKVEGKDPPL